MVEDRSVRRALCELDAGTDDDDDDDNVGVGLCTVMRGIVAGLEESGTEHTSSNRACATALAAAPPRGAGGGGLSPARSSAVHCSAPLERARVGRRNTRVSVMRVQRAVGAPVVLCARRSVRTCSVISTLCLTGAVAEIACNVNCGASSPSPSSLSSPASSNLGFLLLLLFVLGNDGESLRLVVGCWEDVDVDVDG